MSPEITEDNIDNGYAVTRKDSEFKELYEWAKSGTKPQTPTKSEGKSEVIPEEQARLPWKGQEEKALQAQDIDITNPSMEDVLGTLLNPGEWPGLIAGGAVQSGIKGAIDWTLLGIPSLAKGVVGFGKGVVKGLGAKAMEKSKPILEGLAGATPEAKITVGKIADTVQPTVSKLAGQEISGRRWYHGTGEDFSEFLPEKIRSTTHGKGFYFTDDPEIASGYAREGAPNIRIAKLSISNSFPYDDMLKNPTPEVRAKAIELLKDSVETTGSQADKQLVNEMWSKIEKGANPLNYLHGEDIGVLAQSLGYDSILYQGGKITGGKSHNVMVVFDSKKIESAFTQAEGVSSSINQKIEETSTKLKDLASRWDSIKETATRGHISHEEARARGRELGMQIEDIKNLFPGTAMNAEQASALIDTIKPIADDSVKAAQRYLKTRKPEDLHEALYKFYSLMEIDPKRFGVVAEAGRTLSQMNEPISGVNQYLNQFSKLFSELVPEGLTPEYLIHLIGHLETPEQLAIMARHAAKPGSIKSWANALLEGWTMGLLSGPRTHVVNFTSNLLTAIEGPIERGLAARMAFGSGEHVVPGEATAMMYGIVKNFSDALSLAGKAFKTGTSQFNQEKVEFIRQKAISAEALNLSGTIGRAVDYIGEVARIPGRALVAGDDFFKSLNYKGNIEALALREGKSKGLQGKELSEFIRSFTNSPPTRADALSTEYANYMTFNKELEGIAGSVQDVLQRHPMLRVFFPFWRTPVNIAKFSLERTPFLNALSGQLRSDISAGGVRRDMALGKIAFGGMVSSVVYAMARMGLITGTGPSDKNLRNTMKQAGWQPDSIKVGNTYYAYNRVDPMAQYIGSIADLAQISDDLDQPRIDQYAMALTLGSLSHLTTKSYLTGLNNLLEAIKQPDQRGRDYVKQWSSSLVPTIVRHTANLEDPVRRETRGILDQLKSNTPWVSKDLPPMRDLKGDPIIREGTLGPELFSFIFKTKMKEDPVWQEIYKNKISISPVPKYMGGVQPPSGLLKEETQAHGIELNPKEYDWVQRMAGNELKVDGKGMWDSLGELIKTPEYKTATAGEFGGKARFIKKIVDVYRNLAFEKLRDPELNPALNNLLIDKEIQRMQSLMP